ncbi:hypothetical protein ACH5RR_009809 [Cinchona calisaya]|uniref:RING-type domain-containing protein n=1 Tax=Cinchona calisaya TaxID=153742 RepID=A0ABD3AFH2_9GENT
MMVTAEYNFTKESQSPQSRQWSEQNRPSTRASSLLQIWRELEGEHVVNHPRMQRQRSQSSNTDSVSTFMSDGPESFNGNESLEANDFQNERSTYSQSHVGSENEHDDSISVGSEQSTDLGEVERGRVRQIFREWMNSGAKIRSLSVSHRNNSKAQWLGENERERVRIIMEWVQVNCQQRGNCDSPRDEGASEIGPQINLVRDGLLVNHGENCERKAIRKLCGRQALLDLLTRAQRERKTELQELLGHRPVSNFTHRNRIQSLLRGRFLRNERIIQDERPNSRAASELGLLRQRHTVSDLREGFVSRLDNSVPGSLNISQSVDVSSNEEHHSYRNGQLESEEEQEVLEDIYDLFEPSDEERETIDFPEAGLDFDRIGNTNQQHSAASEEQVHLIGQGDQGQELVTNVDYACTEGSKSDVSGNCRANVLVHETSEIETSVQGLLLDAGEVFQEQDATSSAASDAHEVGGLVEDLQVNEAEDFNWQETSAQVEEGQESALDHVELEWQQLTSTEANEWADDSEEGLAGTQQENIANQWDQERPDNDFGERDHAQEPHEDWHDDGLQEAIDSWLDAPTELGQEVGSIGRIDTFYFSGDDNVSSMELRELLSRRRVSSLLRSGFRASLDQIIQSYVERQGNASIDWDADGTSSPALVEQDQEHQNGDQVQDGDPPGIVDRTSSETASQPIWDQDLHHVNWSHGSPHHNLGIQEWEIINNLRMDMVRLQQCMDNMQRMLEACMDMQLELQRCIRQEVSAALNRSAVSTDACKDDQPNDDSKWEFVRKGICCMCCEHNIDSLLYRCAHMCTCSKCAEKLVKGKNKCPMCWAPVIEAVRAYSVQ